VFFQVNEPFPSFGDACLSVGAIDVDLDLFDFMQHLIDSVSKVFGSYAHDGGMEDDRVYILRLTSLVFLEYVRKSADIQ